MARRAGGRPRSCFLVEVYARDIKKWRQVTITAVDELHARTVAGDIWRGGCETRAVTFLHDAAFHDTKDGRRDIRRAR